MRDSHGLSHIEAWVFDLDNTLYPAATNLFPQIDMRMKAFIAESLKLTLEDAFALQKRYYREYGTTLRGLMLNHGVPPERFLEFVHDVDHSVLAQDTRLEAALAALPGRKIIYTNGSERHAVNVIGRLGIARHFCGIFDIRAADYIPKPDPASYARLVARHAIAPARAAMFEDIHRNLKPAAALGMTTVWVRHRENPATADEDISHCAYVTDNLIDWLASAAPARPT